MGNEAYTVGRMVISKPVLLVHLDYSAWADQRLLDACSDLPAEELRRDLGGSHRSIAETLRHLYYAERIWLRRLLAGSLPSFNSIGDQRLFQDPSPEPGLSELKQKWPEIWDGLRQWLEQLPDADLESDLHSQLMNGDEFRMARWKVLLHVVNHSTLHRGQVMAMLRQLGKKPPGTDLFAYYRLS